MKDEEAEAKKKIEDAFSSAGLEVPYLKDVLAKLPIDKARAQKIVTLLFATACSSRSPTISSSTAPPSTSSANGCLHSRPNPLALT